MDQNKEVRRARARGLDMMAITALLAVGTAADMPVDMADARSFATMRKARKKKDRTSAKLAKKSRKKNRK